MAFGEPASGVTSVQALVTGSHSQVSLSSAVVTTGPPTGPVPVSPPNTTSLLLTGFHATHAPPRATGDVVAVVSGVFNVHAVPSNS